jgi:dihydrofolate reductase
MIRSVFIATSLDGYIARANGDIDWLMAYENIDEDYGYRVFMDTVDVLVMGRHSFEKVRTFGAWPYGDTRVVVLSSGSINIPEDIRETVESMFGTPTEIHNHVSATAHQTLGFTEVNRIICFRKDLI